MNSTAQALYPIEMQERVDAYLAELSLGGTAGAETLVEAMRYSLLAGGKRVRPVLALATAEALGHEPDGMLPFAAAIEMIHTYSLIHDDLPAMDDDELRRGKPTCHVAYGEDVAILAGDGLFAEALRLAAAEQEADPAALLAAVAELTAAVGVDGMVGGQFLDVTAPGDLGEAELRRVHELKTGRLIAASVNCALHLCRASASARLSYGRFASELGVLFQIVDDILDVTGDDAALGKPSGSDERHGKRTYVTVYGLDRARELARESHAKARATLADSDGDTGTLERITDHILTRQN